MFTRYLLLDDTADDSNRGRPWLRWKVVSKVESVRDAFAKLDGDRHSILIVSENPPPGPGRDEPFFAKALTIAGGKDDQYLCEAFLEDEYTPVRLCNPDAENPKEDVWLTRGQPETFPRYHIVNGEVAQRALMTFARTGQLDDGLVWEH